MWQRIKSLISNPSEHIEWYVAIVGLMFGLIFLIIIPPMQGPDETNQFLRAYQVSNGDLVADYVGYSQGGIATYMQTFDHNVGGIFSSGIVNFTFEAFARIPQHSTAKMTKAEFRKLANYRVGSGMKAAAFGNTAAYSPVAYVPQVLSLWIGRLFGASPLVLLYLARLGGLMASIALIALAVRIMPFGKLPLAVIALLPMTVGQLSIVNADSMTIAIAFLSVAVVFCYAFRDQDLDRREVVYVVGLFAVLGLIKPSLLPLSLASLLFLRNESIKKQKAIKVISASLFAAAVCGLAWNLLVKNEVILGYHMSYPADNYVAQLRYILHYPWGYARVLANTFLTSNLNYVPTSFIGYFGWADTPLPLLAVIAGFMLVGFAFFVNVQWEKVQVVIWGRWLLFLSFVTVALLTATYMYLFCDAPGDPFIVGIQGRYFIPALVLLPPMFCGGHRLLKPDQYERYVRWALRASFVLLIVMAFVTFSRFYNAPTIL